MPSTPSPRLVLGSRIGSIRGEGFWRADFLWAGGLFAGGIFPEALGGNLLGPGGFVGLVYSLKRGGQAGGPLLSIRAELVPIGIHGH